MDRQSWWTVMSQDETGPVVTKQMISRVYGYAKPYLPQIALLLLLDAVATVLSVLPPKVIQLLIDKAFSEDGDPSMLDKLALVLVLIPLARGVITIASRRIVSSVSSHLVCKLRNDLLEHMLQMSIRFMSLTKRGELGSRLRSDVHGAQNALTQTIRQVMDDLATVVFTLAFMVSIDWMLTLYALAVVPIFLFAARNVTGIMRDLTKDTMDKRAALSSHVGEAIDVSGLLLIKLFGRQESNLKEFERLGEEWRQSTMKSGSVSTMFWVSLSLASSIGTAVVYYYGGHLVLEHSISLGTLIAFTSYLRMIYSPITDLANCSVAVATSLVSFERVFEVLDVPIEISDAPHAKSLHNVQGDVVFDNVSFTYSAENAVTSTGEPVVARLETQKRFWRRRGRLDADYEPPKQLGNALTNVSFHIKPGQTAALVGPSGAGKTTITSLIPRLYDVSSGAIRIDDTDIRDVTQLSLTDSIGMVTQDVYLFNDTIRANLVYARPDATQQQIEHACKVANIYDVIMDMPEKFDTIVGERGYRMSGGEKQRLSIARVILKDPRILIMDEATSSLDSHSEELIQQALQPLFSSHSRTCLVIAHRLSTILSADTILVLDKGCLVEQGSHQELLQRNGLYASLFHTQFKNATAVHPVPEHHSKLDIV